MCPSERNALKYFYESTKGDEWTDSTYWIDPHTSHCAWQGVSCRNDTVVGLNLAHNGLSGKLDERIAELGSLEVLDLSDNDIKVSFVSICICRAS